MNQKVKTLMTSKFEMFKNLLKSNGKHKKSQGQVYAVGTGIFVGEMFVYVKKDNESYHFLSVPKNINRSVPVDKFEWAITHKIMEYVNRLPSDVYKICIAQYKYNVQNGGTAKLNTK